MTKKLLIEPLYHSGNRLFRYWPDKRIVQTIPFELGYKISNIGDEPIRNFTINKFEISSAENQDMYHQVEGAFHYDTINPNSEVVVWIGELGTNMYGLVRFSLLVIPDEIGTIIETYQKDEFTKKITEYKGVNTWLDFRYISTKAEHASDRNNNIMLMLTIAMLIYAIISVRMTYRYQVAPVIQGNAHAVHEAKKFCTENSSLTYPGNDGREIPCKDVLQIDEARYDLTNSFSLLRSIF